MTVANADPPKPINTTDSHSRQVNFFNSCNRGSKIGTTKKAMTICSMSTMAVEEISVVKNFFHSHCAHGTYSHRLFGGTDFTDRKSTRLNSSHQIISYAV